ncbi:MAG: hypothetical protein RL609_1379 [Bacteroidota bacterium]|jgi:CheY-like chemotaxis protein
MSKKILLVEDDEIIAFLHRHFAEKCGFEVIDTVDNGRSAIQETKDLNPDAVLMDIRINGEMDGIEAAMKIREFSNTPIIFLTGNSDENTLNRAKEAGSVGYLVKPVRHEELCALLAQITN